MRGNIRTIILIVGVLWVIEFVNTVFFDHLLGILGVWPRDFYHLYGILLAPLWHADSEHLLSNTVPFVVFSYLVMLGGRARFWTVIIVTTIVSGGGIWLFGASGSVHYGASGVVFGLFGYLLADGWYRRDSRSILITLLVFMFFGGMLWGLISFRPGISWEGHFFGFWGGVFAAKILAEEKRDAPAV